MSPPRLAFRGLSGLLLDIGDEGLAVQHPHPRAVVGHDHVHRCGGGFGAGAGGEMVELRLDEVGGLHHHSGHLWHVHRVAVVLHLCATGERTAQAMTAQSRDDTGEPNSGSGRRHELLLLRVTVRSMPATGAGALERTGRSQGSVCDQMRRAISGGGWVVCRIVLADGATISAICMEIGGSVGDCAGLLELYGRRRGDRLMVDRAAGRGRVLAGRAALRAAGVFGSVYRVVMVVLRRSRVCSEAGPGMPPS